jgi:hypothetical protein
MNDENRDHAVQVCVRHGDILLTVCMPHKPKSLHP